jgi:hypothetical protein
MTIVTPPLRKVGITGREKRCETKELYKSTIQTENKSVF